jgi:hypothetical protein
VSFPKGSFYGLGLCLEPLEALFLTSLGFLEGSGSVTGKVSIKEFSSLAVVTGCSEDKPRGAKSKPLGFGFSPGRLIF